MKTLAAAAALPFWPRRVVETVPFTGSAIPLVRMETSRGSQFSLTTVCARLRIRRSELVDTKHGACEGEASAATCSSIQLSEF